MKKGNARQEYLKRKSLEGGVQFALSEEKIREDGLMKIKDFHKPRAH